ncbi:unnamed protein product, partial [Mesorhabditis belari]|uniref:Methionine--tRNA ligase, cytoplasmic n=1 Tax=Mesorhabditis belari TaxID=2138241 RepID=A0AAF3EQD6_9BILA
MQKEYKGTSRTVATKALIIEEFKRRLRDNTTSLNNNFQNIINASKVNNDDKAHYNPAGRMTEFATTRAEMLARAALIIRACDELHKLTTDIKEFMMLHDVEHRSRNIQQQERIAAEDFRQQIQKHSELRTDLVSNLALGLRFLLVQHLSIIEMVSQIPSWNAKPTYFEDRKEKILPVKDRRNVLITSALPYVNNVPHLGNIIGCVLSGDVFARYSRQRGHQTLYICGTDEYGTATETKALQEGLTPKQVCDKYHAIHKEIYEWFNIHFDSFGRTSTPEQTEICQEIFFKLQKNGFTSVASIDQLHCETCNKFLADRYVNGICPHCGFTDARGDQCDDCGKLYNAVELKSPKCHICKNEPKVKQSEHVFLALDKLQPEVAEYIEKQLALPHHRWSTNAIAIAKGWIKGGLEKRCITRDLEWGVPVPLEELKKKVFYVWYDAPIGYISITKTLLGDEWTQWWKNPENVELYQFIGKDNVAFHAVMFPCTQIGTRDNFTIVNNLCATEYLNYEDKKFSKSRGTGVFGDAAKGTGIDADVWRFYLLYMRPESQDTSFSWDDFSLKVNSELLANLGNFVNRALTFIANNYGGVIQEMQLQEADIELLKGVEVDLKEWDQLMDEVKLKDAVKTVLNLSRRGNQYMQSNAPWALLKGSDEEKKRAGTVISIAANVAYTLALILHPIMPKISEHIREQCGAEKLPLFTPEVVCYLKVGHKIGKPQPLFVKIEKATIDELKARFAGAESDQKKEAKSKKPNKGIQCF